MPNGPGLAITIISLIISASIIAFANELCLNLKFTYQTSWGPFCKVPISGLDGVFYVLTILLAVIIGSCIVKLINIYINR